MLVDPEPCFLSEEVLEASRPVWPDPAPIIQTDIELDGAVAAAAAPKGAPKEGQRRRRNRKLGSLRKKQQRKQQRKQQQKQKQTELVAILSRGARSLQKPNRTINQRARVEHHRQPVPLRLLQVPAQAPHDAGSNRQSCCTVKKVQRRSDRHHKVVGMLHSGSGQEQSVLSHVKQRQLGL